MSYKKIQIELKSGDRLQNQENNKQNETRNRERHHKNKNSKAEEYKELNEKCNTEHQ